MKYLLDTNICIHFFKGKFDLIDKLTEIGIENCAISEITLAELIYGAENSTNPKKNHDIIEKFIYQTTILPIFSSILQYGKQKAKLRKKGMMISDFDLLIGCTAIENNLIMVTENVREFERMHGIKIENWIKRK
ncbi:MAG: type II toxin-antitoxin system VapC family toxin [Saprospiraceae bacterium]|nr:type II toxin-antitoxin system VapC family toxin [Saprospiraceae bacterium]